MLSSPRSVLGIQRQLVGQAALELAVRPEDRPGSAPGGACPSRCSTACRSTTRRPAACPARACAACRSAGVVQHLDLDQHAGPASGARPDRPAPARRRDSALRTPRSGAAGWPGGASRAPSRLPPRSKPSVVCASSQPWPSAPMRFSAGTFTLVKKTSLNSELPVICLSGRTSTPGACMSRMKYEMPWCLGTSGSVRARSTPKSAMWPEAGPHLLAVDDVVVAVLEASRTALVLQAGQVGARVGLRVQLAPDVLGGQDALDVALLLLLGAVGDQRRADEADAQAVDARPARCRAPSPRPTMACSIGRASWPPYSFGQPMPTKPASYSVRCQAFFCCERARADQADARRTTGGRAGERLRLQLNSSDPHLILLGTVLSARATAGRARRAARRRAC